MMPRARPIFALAFAGMLLAAACGSASPTLGPGGTPVATPDVQATIEARALRAALGTPTPTAVPGPVRAAALEFAASYGSTAQDWDRFHTDFDAWREGLVACDASSAQVALGGFAGRFVGMTEAARALPRSAVVRDLADSLISAAETEERALRLLRDAWRPGAVSAPSQASDGSEQSNAQEQESLFEAVDRARSEASALRGGVTDALTDREAKAVEVSRAQVESFAASFQALDSSWEEFHRAYDGFRSQEGQLASAEAGRQLALLVDQFREIVAAVSRLPAYASTREVAAILAPAADEEDLALRQLRGAFRGGAGNGKQPEGAAAAADGQGSAPSNDNSGTGNATPTTNFEPGFFDGFDDQLVKSNAARRSARQALAGIQEDLSQETQAVVEQFGVLHGSLNNQWDAFHRDYDEWRRTDGGCDRSQAVETLGRFVVSFGEISGTVRSLPTVTSLRPLGEILVEAVEREERALRELRKAWRPFEAAVYGTLDQERGNAGRLRRQAAAGIRDLLEQYGISPEEVSQHASR